MSVVDIERVIDEIIDEDEWFYYTDRERQQLVETVQVYVQLEKERLRKIESGRRREPTEKKHG
jgi:cell fate regulator YaaT (PSP1 superfamily)